MLCRLWHGTESIEINTPIGAPYRKKRVHWHCHITNNLRNVSLNMTAFSGTGEQGRGISDAEVEALRNSLMHQQHHQQPSTTSARGLRVSESELEAILESFQNESYSEKTWSRWLVEKYLQHVSFGCGVLP